MAPRNNSSTDKPKRVRRKCTAPGCTNRVVQGGVCVTHGAKRKLCSVAGCSKAVKLAGFCSSHGPTRKKCDYVDPSSGGPCTRVAVQGGRCLSHGARRRFCAFPGKVCTKNAVQGGYCKKHHDLVQDASGMLVLQSSPSIKSDSGDKSESYCMPVGTSAVSGGSIVSGASSASVSDQSFASSSVATGVQGAVPSSLEYEQQAKSAPKKKSHAGKFPTPQHRRGLSIFDEMQTVDAIIGMGDKQRESGDTDAASAAEGITSLASQRKKLNQIQEQPDIPPQQQSYDDKTPRTQVTFADGTRSAPEVPVTVQPTTTQDNSECLRNPSCSCAACRSPTLAIFEQMLQASHKLEQGEDENDRYAGLSPPKLSPSKRSSAISRYSKSVRFPNEHPSSSTSEGMEGSTENYDGTSSIPPSRNRHQAEESPASSALAAVVKIARDVDEDASHVNRTVSHDVESPRSRYYYHHPYYGYPPSRNYHPSQYYHQQQQHHHQHHPQHHPQHPSQYYYQQQPYPQHYYRPHEPIKAPGTPILNDDTPGPTQSSSESRRDSKKKQKRLLPKPRGTDMEHLFIPSEK